MVQKRIILKKLPKVIVKFSNNKIIKNKIKILKKLVIPIPKNNNNLQYSQIKLIIRFLRNSMTKIMKKIFNLTTNIIIKSFKIMNKMFNNSKKINKIQLFQILSKNNKNTIPIVKFLMKILQEESQIYQISQKLK